MNKKILFGSIIALCILIGVTFTSVVGYRSVAFDVKESPLFTIRTKRVGGQDVDIATRIYLGKGDTSILQLPPYNDTFHTHRMVVKRISTMDERELQRFITVLIYYLSANTIRGLENKDKQQIITILNHYKQNPAMVLNQLNTQSNYYARYVESDVMEETLDYGCTFGQWVPGCFIDLFKWLILLPLFLFLLALYFYFNPTALPPC